MANGLEDLQEKNKNKAAPLDKHQFSQWNNFQGREDAEMLEEKSSRWNAKKAARREYDAWSEED
ncbi:MAG: hypothetical protein IK015_08100 [Treponema sp.]|nr:hypothetical protein [Treponema sp.]